MAGLDELIDAAVDDLHALTLYKTAKGYQANRKNGRTDGWLIATAATPSAALRALLERKAPPAGSIFD